MSKIVTIQWGYLSGTRLRHAGSNARLGDHGSDLKEPYAVITLDDGLMGFAYARLTEQQAKSVIGKSLDELITVESGTRDDMRFLDFALWDVLAKRANKPVYALLNSRLGDNLFRVPCYDTSLYIDDLHLKSDNDAATLLADHARQGFERGHRAFKIKVGRGALHMPLKEGNQRDIAVIRAVREAVGEDCTVMIDANNGYNFNITQHILAETADCDLYWIEEAFHEDAVLYGHLRDWMQKEGLSVLIADGEGHASPDLMQWARDGIIDVVQHDLRQHSFSRWLDFARELDSYQSLSAPHNYGSAFGEYASCHLAAGIRYFSFVESDHITMQGLDATGYQLEDGFIHVPHKVGFGLTLDVSALGGGFTIS